MAENIKVWFDSEADFLEVLFANRPGFLKATSHEGLMERVDAEGRVIGFSILGVSRFSKENPLAAELTTG